MPDRKMTAASHPRRRRWLFRLAAVVLAPAIALAVLEVVLRVAGFGFDTSFFVKERIGDRDYLVNNDDFVLRFFPPDKARRPKPIRMEAVKPANTCRIFVMGESAALGDPDPAYGASRYLGALLNEKFPALKFEVVNVSITAINSHSIVPIARECAERQGDLWILYMGNNEMIGPFGAASVFGSQAPPWQFVRLSLALQKTRVGQCLMTLARRFKDRKPATTSWAGLEMFVENRIPPGDPRKEVVYQNFKRNLDDILRAGLESGAKVILDTVAVNLRDCPPLASVSSKGSNSESIYADGAKLERDGQFAEAAHTFAKAVETDAHRADAQYHWAECLLNAANPSAARTHFSLARDDDAMPVRTDSRINGIIRDAARQLSSPGLIFFDADEGLGTNCAGGVCGGETFYEHVHFNYDGNYGLALAWAERVEGTLPSKVRQSAKSSWLSQEICQQRLGLTDWNRRNDLAEVLRRRQRPPLSQQDNNAQQSQALREQINQLSRRMDTDNAAAARAVYVDAIARAPEDLDLYSNFADYLESVGDVKEAIVQWQTLQRLMPSYFLSFFQEGRLRERQGDLATARSAFVYTLTLNPGMAPAWYELSNIDASQGRFNEALKEVGRAAALEPGQGIFYACEGKLLSKMNRHTEALARFHKAVEVQPDYVDGYNSLGAELAANGKFADARTQFLAGLRLDPENKTARAYMDQIRGK